MCLPVKGGSFLTSPVPETRPSLILRLADEQDAEAWDEFVEIYSPLIYALARSKSLQDADAREVVQEVLLAVSRAVERWNPDKELGRFRDWLFRIARNMVINVLTRKKFRPICDQQDSASFLLNQPSPQAVEESAQFDLEYRRQVFHWSANRTKSEVADQTWNAFWLSTVEAKSITNVADELQITTGAVYVARSRVMAKLRKHAARFEAEAPKLDASESEEQQ